MKNISLSPFILAAILTGASIIVQVSHAHPDSALIPICTVKGPQEGVAIAVDEKKGRFLCAFNDGRGRTSDIHGELIREDGKKVRKDIPLFKGEGFQAWPSLHFDVKRRLYIVVWQENSPDGSSRIMGSFTDDDGRSTDGIKSILKSRHHLSSTLILGSEGKELLILFYDGSPRRSGLKGVVLSEDLEAKGVPFLISPYVSKGVRVRAALNEEKGEWLVVWKDLRNGKDPDIYGRIINRKGQSLSFDIPVSTGSDIDDLPVVAFDPFEKLYLVAWQRASGGERYLDIYGRFIRESGEPEGSEFVICGKKKDQGAPSVAFDYRRRRFLVVWEDASKGIYNIRGAWVGRDKKVDLQENAFSPSPHMQVSPVVIFNRQSKMGLIAWEEYVNGDWNIMGLIINGR